MAHFAELDSNNVVKQVIVVSNADTSTAQGEEKESIGIAFCERLLGGTWVKTSYNGNIRKNYAGIGYTYLEEFDLDISCNAADFLMKEERRNIHHFCRKATKLLQHV